MESQDYNQIKQEEKEEIDRQVYQDQLSEFEIALSDVISQAKTDDIDIEDVIKNMRRGLLFSYEYLVEIERV